MGVKGKQGGLVCPTGLCLVADTIVFLPWAPSLVPSLLVEQQPYSLSGTFWPGKSVTMSAKTPPGSGIKWPGPKTRLSLLWKGCGPGTSHLAFLGPVSGAWRWLRQNKRSICRAPGRPSPRINQFSEIPKAGTVVGLCLRGKGPMEAARGLPRAYGVILSHCLGSVSLPPLGHKLVIFIAFWSSASNQE